MLDANNNDDFFDSHALFFKNSRVFALHITTISMTKLCFTFAALAVSTLADGPPPPRVTTGAAALAESGFASLIGKRVGICSNPTGVLPSLQHIVDVMHSNANATTSLVAIFGPEHGFRGDEQAGQADDYYVDRETGLPVYSLYAKTVTEARQVFRNATVDTVPSLVLTML